MWGVFDGSERGVVSPMLSHLALWITADYMEKNRNSVDVFICRGGLGERIVLGRIIIIIIIFL